MVYGKGRTPGSRSSRAPETAPPARVAAARAVSRGRRLPQNMTKSPLLVPYTCSIIRSSPLAGLASNVILRERSDRRISGLGCSSEADVPARPGSFARLKRAQDDNGHTFEAKPPLRERTKGEGVFRRSLNHTPRKKRLGVIVGDHLDRRSKTNIRNEADLP